MEHSSDWLIAPTRIARIDELLTLTSQQLLHFEVFVSEMFGVISLIFI